MVVRKTESIYGIIGDSGIYHQDGQIWVLFECALNGITHEMHIYWGTWWFPISDGFRGTYPSCWDKAQVFGWFGDEYQETPASRKSYMRLYFPINHDLILDINAK